MKNIGIRHIENRKFQILDGTEKYAEFYIKAKLTYMVYLQNGKLCRLEVNGSVDDSYIPDYEATLHFGGKSYDLLYNEDVENVAKRLECNPNAIYGLQLFIEEEFNDARISNIPYYHSDELPDGVSIEFVSKDTLGDYNSESEYSYSMKVGEKNIPINVYIVDQGDYGYVKSIMFDLGSDGMINVVYGNNDGIYTNSGIENYKRIVILEKLLGLKPGDGIKIIHAI